MFINYLKIGWRNLTKNKVYSIITIGGLAVSMAACLLIWQFLYFELSYDRFHDSYQNVYRVIIENVSGELNEKHPRTGYELGVAAKTQIPGVNQYVRKTWFSRGALVTNPINNNVYHKEAADLLFVDPAFLEVFNFPLKTGGSTLFEDKFSVVITDEMAKAYFGDDDPIGRTLNIDGRLSMGTYTVTGVLEDLPLNSHMQFDFLLPMENFIEHGWGGAVKNQGGWGGFKVGTYLAIDESADLDLVQGQLNELLARHTTDGGNNNETVKKVLLQPIEDIYLKSGSLSDPGYFTETGNLRNIQIFFLVSIFILIIAWINYINLTTARSLNREKEVGIRKSIGANKGQLIGQFILEAFLINTASSMMAFGLAFLLLPVLNQVVGKESELTMMLAPEFWVWFSMVVFLGSILSGLYPAFALSTTNPLSMLGSAMATRVGNVNLRRGLITFQFLISLVFISGTYLVYKQTTFMKNHELSADLEKILILEGPKSTQDDTLVIAKFPAFKNELIQHHSVVKVAGSFSNPGEFGALSYRKAGLPVTDAVYTRHLNAGIDFPEAYSLKFIAGNSFKENMVDEEVVIINHASIQAFGFESPEDAIQQKLQGRGEKQVTIVGVVEDFDWHSLAEPRTPYVIGLYENVLQPYIFVRMNLSNITESLTHIEKTYKSIYPGNPFDYYFADEAFNKQYQAEVQFGNLFFVFTLLAIFISCIGLFAMVSYSATSKIKEIGIRKVLGASTGNLMMLLSREYLILISIAIVMAIPVILYFGGSWLDNYASRINMGADLFIIPTLVLIIVSILTVSHRTYATANANPVKSLKSE